MKIKHTKYFVYHTLAYIYFGHWSLATKFRLREKFTSEIFYRWKYPNLWYIYILHHWIVNWCYFLCRGAGHGGGGPSESRPSCSPPAAPLLLEHLPLALKSIKVYAHGVLYVIYGNYWTGKWCRVYLAFPILTLMRGSPLIILKIAAMCLLPLEWNRETEG